MPLTIQSVIDLLISQAPGAPFEKTVDTVKAGDPTQPLRGIVTTFMATRPVIAQAQAAGANFIITHEPIYYNHEDKIDWLQGDAVFEAKHQFLTGSGITVWRFHDYWHSYHPDGIQVGFARRVGWEFYQDAQDSSLYHLPPTPLAKLAVQLKARLGMPSLRLVGDPNMTCQHVSAMLGAPGGDWLMVALRSAQVDTLLCGETVEWQICEYARDSAFTSQPKAVIVLGHERSEEMGMAYLADWLKDHLPDVPVRHIPSGDPFQYL